MHVNMTISEPAFKIINKRKVIAVYWLKPQTTSHGDFMFRLVCVLGLLFTNTAGIKFDHMHVPFKSFYVWTNWLTLFR